jgi:hypothetical protein
MGKGKRSRQRKRKKTNLQVIEGGKPLKGRPEYEAHMQAWREAGSPPG